MWPNAEPVDFGHSIQGNFRFRTSKRLFDQVSKRRWKRGRRVEIRKGDFRGYQRNNYPPIFSKFPKFLPCLPLGSFHLCSTFDSDGTQVTTVSTCTAPVRTSAVLGVVSGAHFIEFRFSVRCGARCCVFRTSVPGAVLGDTELESRRNTAGDSPNWNNKSQKTKTNQRYPCIQMGLNRKSNNWKLKNTASEARKAREHHFRAQISWEVNSSTSIFGVFFFETKNDRFKVLDFQFPWMLNGKNWKGVDRNIDLDHSLFLFFDRLVCFFQVLAFLTFFVAVKITVLRTKILSCRNFEKWIRKLNVHERGTQWFYGGFRWWGSLPSGILFTIP